MLLHKWVVGWVAEKADIIISAFPVKLKFRPETKFGKKSPEKIFFADPQDLRELLVREARVRNICLFYLPRQ